MKIEVICSPCDRTGMLLGSYGRLTEEHVFEDTNDPRLYEATVIANATFFCKPGLSVVVRPRYNAKGTDAKSGEVMFYEWRSFNGEDLKLVEFKQQ